MQDIYSELVEDACLGLCFEVHRAVKQGYFFLDETDQESTKEFGWCRHSQLDVVRVSRGGACSHPRTRCLFRDRGRAGRGRLRAGVQPVEEQGVRVSQLQAADRGVPFRAAPGEMSRDGAQQQPHCQPQVRPLWTESPPSFAGAFLSECLFFIRLASNNNTSKSESDQEDNDDVNDNDWSYGAEKKGEGRVVCTR